jgi:hypothetical protein
MHQHPEGAGDRDLLGQHRDKLRIVARHEMRQHGNAEAGERGVELRDQIGAAQARGNPRRHLRQIVQLGREQELLDVTDEAVLRQHLA